MTGRNLLYADRRLSPKNRTAIRWTLSLLVGFSAQVIVISPFLAPSQKDRGDSLSTKDKVFFIDSGHYRNLNSFLKSADPEALSKPDLTSGFSSIIQKDKTEKKLPASQLSWRNPGMKFKASEIKYSAFCDGRDAGQSEKLASLWRPLNFSETPIVNKNNGLSYPLCSDRNGDMIKLSISQDEIAGIVAQNPPKYITVVTISFGDGAFPRTELLSSSGNNELDLFAVKKLLSEHRSMRKIADASSDRSLNMFFHWRKGIKTCLK